MIRSALYIIQVLLLFWGNKKDKNITLSKCWKDQCSIHFSNCRPWKPLCNESPTRQPHSNFEAFFDKVAWWLNKTEILVWQSGRFTTSFIVVSSYSVVVYEHLYPLFILCSVSDTLIYLCNENHKSHSHTKLQQLLTFTQLNKHAEILQQSEKFATFHPLVCKLWKNRWWTKTTNVHHSQKIGAYVLTKKNSGAIMRRMSERTSTRSCQENCCLGALLQQQPNSEKSQMFFTALWFTHKDVTRPGWGRGIISFLFTIRGAEDKLPFVKSNPLLINRSPIH